MKSVARWSKLTGSRRERLIGFLHVPLDSFSLSFVKGFAATGDYGQRMNIPCNATMSYIKSEPMYDRLQKLMRAVAAAASVSPICIDLLAWDSVHA